MRTPRLSIVAASVASCLAAIVPANAAAPESITYETGACFGACPVYTVTVRSDGSGLFEGRRFTAVTGRRTFRVTPGQYRAFVAQLAPLRPRRGVARYWGPPLCSGMATDQASADVKWDMHDGGGRELSFYYGCDMGARQAMVERLGNAPDLLPIGAFIGRRR